ncbi:MAG: Crp/Fnr family transcriptional regulator [Lewinella sp.]|nr:Crp/Fnr family transcriptional regulator [Lewinella sp.]
MQELKALTPDQERIRSVLRDQFPQLNEPDLIQDIIQQGRLVEYKHGEPIADFGSYVRFVPLVVEGTFKVMRATTDGEIFLYYVHAGEACASSFSCCLTQKKSFIRAVAEDDLLVVALPVAKVDEWLSRFRSWKDFIMQSYEDRLMELVEAIDSIAFLKMDERLWQYLQERARVTENFTIQTTHQEIAADLNASREAISRLLKQLERQGKIELGRNRIDVRAMR